MSVYEFPCAEDIRQGAQTQTVLEVTDPDADGEVAFTIQDQGGFREVYLSERHTRQLAVLLLKMTLPRLHATLVEHIVIGRCGEALTRLQTLIKPREEAP